MKKVVSVCLLFIVSFIVNGQTTLKQFVDSIANQYLSKNKNLALIIGVNDRGEEQIFRYGETETGDGKSPDVSDIFEIGQITEVFTSILYADLTINGKIGADDPLQKYLPVDVVSPVYQPVVCKPSLRVSGRNIDGNERDNQGFISFTPYVCFPDTTIRPQPILLCYLSTHTSGLPDMPSNIKSEKKNPYAGYTKEMLYDFMRNYSINAPIGYDFRYSSLGMALLGHAMELKSKQSYENLLSEHIFSKIDMPNTKIALSDSMQQKFLHGHNSNGKTAENWTFDVMAPCAGLHSNMTDMMKFLSANITKVASPMKNLLDYTHNPRIQFHNEKYGNSEIALGWFVSPLDSDNSKYVWQEGLTGGFASFIGFVETSRAGVVILSNTTSGVADLGKEILKKMCP